MEPFEVARASSWGSRLMIISAISEVLFPFSFINLNMYKLKLVLTFVVLNVLIDMYHFIIEQVNS